MTISEIAKLADVSAAAVSRYLNQGYVSAEKAERIKKVIDETGYVPSAQARNLRIQKTKMIGVVIPKIDSESISRTVAGISQELAKAGYELLLANTMNDTNKELNYLRVFDKSRVDGVIFIATMLSEKHEKLLKNMKIPVVMIGQEDNNVSCIYHDDYGAAKEITSYITSGRHRTPGYIGVSMEDKAAGAERFRGFEDALKEKRLTYNKKAMVVGEFTMESGYEGAKKIMKSAPDTDVIFCATDNIAIGAMTYLKEKGIRIPEDVSISGIGHTKMSRVSTPTLTTVHYFYKTAGLEGARMLLEKLEKPDTPVKQMKLGYEIIRLKSV